MTLKDIEARTDNFLSAEDVAAIMEAAPQTIRNQAQDDPRKLGFPVVVIGTRVRIPRLPFVRFMKYGYAAVADEVAP